VDEFSRKFMTAAIYVRINDSHVATKQVWTHHSFAPSRICIMSTIGDY